MNGCHVEINKPDVSPQSYYNRKKWLSVILQGICDDRNRFIDVFIGFLGSAHNGRVFRESPFFSRRPPTDVSMGTFLVTAYLL